ncbi:MAG: pitrilysin family protein [Mariprofundaceae bacterium]|nr:pitrilysin family protein [Mariprofundaceae bacterium]
MKRLNIRVLSFVCLLFGFSINSYAVPSIQTAQLDNGLKILLVEAHNVPMVSLQLTTPAGSRFDTTNKAGTASMLATVLGDHTAKHDDKAWAEWLDSEAIRLGASASRDTLSLSLTVVKESLVVGLNAFSEALLQPGWHQKRFLSLREDDMAAAIKSQETPGTQAAQATAKLLYGSHGYGHTTSGTAKSLPHIQLNDLKMLYTNQVRPVGSVLAVSGDITMQEILRLLKPRLQTWQGKPSVAALDIKQPSIVRGQSSHVTIPTSQALVQFSRLGIARSSDDFFPLFVMNHLLGGGGFGSKLMEEVREKRGLVYGVYSYFIPLAAPGPFIITLQTRAEQAGKAAQVVRDVMQSLADGNIDKKQLDATKSNLVGSFAQRMDSNRERVGLLSMIGFYQMPLDYLQNWTAHVQSVTLSDVRRMTKAYLQTGDWNIVQVGPAKEQKQ